MTECRAKATRASSPLAPEQKRQLLATAMRAAARVTFIENKRAIK